MKNRNAAFQTLASIICSICIYLYLFASCGYIGPCDFLSDRHFVGLTSPQTLNTFFGGSSKKSGHVLKPKNATDLQPLWKLWEGLASPPCGAGVTEQAVPVHRSSRSSGCE